MALQFDTAVPSGTPASNCVVCKQPVGDAYYTAGKAIVCPSCKTGIETHVSADPTTAQIARAVVYGLGGAVAGAAVYWVVLATLHAMIGIIGIAVGFLVGRAVQLGAGHQRGRVFQVIAAALTYCGIAVGYTAVYKNLIVSMPPLDAIGYTATLPVRSLFGGLITSFGVWQAWVMNRPAQPLTFHGPFRMGAKA
jgi:hypothetical protein